MQGGKNTMRWKWKESSLEDRVLGLQEGWPGGRKKSEKGDAKVVVGA